MKVLNAAIGALIWQADSVLDKLPDFKQGMRMAQCSTLSLLCDHRRREERRGERGEKERKREREERGWHQKLLELAEGG